MRKVIGGGQPYIERSVGESVVRERGSTLTIELSDPGGCFPAMGFAANLAASYD